MSFLTSITPHRLADRFHCTRRNGTWNMLQPEFLGLNGENVHQKLIRDQPNATYVCPMAADGQIASQFFSSSLDFFFPKMFRLLVASPKLLLGLSSGVTWLNHLLPASTAKAVLASGHASLSPFLCRFWIRSTKPAQPRNHVHHP